MITEAEIVSKLRCACIEAGGQKPFAKKHKLSSAYVWGVLAGRQKAGNGIANALGYKLMRVYEKKGA